MQEQKEENDPNKIYEDIRIKASPLADSKLTVKLLHLLKQAGSYNQLKKGMNESLKTLTRSTSEIIIMAADCSPLEILFNFPLLC